LIVRDISDKIDLNTKNNEFIRNKKVRYEGKYKKSFPFPGKKKKKEKWK